jgi:FkbM family methyltransferase
MNNAGEFLDRMLDRYLGALHTVQSDNYDAHRFGADGATQFATTVHRQYLKFFMVHHARLYRTWTLFADAASRGLFEELLLYRLAGHLHVRLSTHTARKVECVERAGGLATGEAGFASNSARKQLRRFRVPFRDELIDLDLTARAVSASFLEAHYFYDRDGVRIAPEDGDVAVDLGACLGDTALAFAAAVGPRGRVFSFEFMPDHLAVARGNLALNPRLEGRVTLVPYAAGRQDNGVEPWPLTEGTEVSIQPGSRVDLQTTRAVPLRSLDAMVDDGSLPRVDFLKLDVEGSELEALEGAKRSIARFRPKLAVSAYHRWEDLFVLAEWIDAHGYELHLDHHSIHAEESVFYARPRAA